MTAAFQRYADRGVFRGFRDEPGARGRVGYHFVWLLRRPMHAVFDPRRGVLTFPSLFPAVAPPAMVARLKALVESRSRRDQPAHKRLDARRARVTCVVRNRDFFLAVQIRGDNHNYAVRHVLGLINELFLLLHETYPDYLIERFGLSAE